MPLWQTIRLEIFIPRFLITVVFSSVIYILLFVFIPNNNLLLYSFSNFSAQTTLALFVSLFIGLPNSLSNIDLFFLLITSVLVGANFAILLATLGRLKNRKVRLSVGGSTILGIVATGCSACGLSIVSLFGLTAATFSFLPFRGMEFNILAITLLFLSFAYTLYKLNEVCEVKY